MTRNTFGKTERLKSRKSIDQLFKDGQRFNVGMIRVFYKTVKQTGIRAGVGVSARVFKKAVDRNRIKRQLRESYRLQKQILVLPDTTEKGLDLFFIYTAQESTEFQELYKAVEKALQKINANLGQSVL
ncbi:MAG: ribonuclease P protein component [Bacteroidetes bacterium]|nr:ribonuclease P protein component [Bacteroidota bacterium]